MLRSSKHLIPILLTALILLVGCAAGKNVSPNDGPTIKPVAYEPMGKAIYAPVEIPYAIDNPLEIINIDVSDGTRHYGNYFQISGLLDQAVENSINEAIKSLFDQMLPYATGEKLAPYRGIQSVVHPSKKIYDSSISVIPQFNCNNVLSVAANVWGNYYHSTDGHIYFSMSEGLNFDLNTGKRFLIADVFTNDVNGLEFINEAIVSELTRRRLAPDMDYDEYAGFTLVAPFKGISHEQKFYLSQDGINVIIDNNNPEFNVGFSNVIVRVPFYSPNGHIAITKRFFDENDVIFTKEARAKRLLRDSQVNISRESDLFVNNGTEWYIITSYPEDLPQALIDIIAGIRSRQEEHIALLSQESPVLFVEQNIYAHRIGPYVNINSHIYFSRTNESQWQEGSYVYSATGQSIRLEDLFREGYDYQALIRDAFEKSRKEYKLAQVPDTEMFLEDVMFKLSDESISFVTMPFDWNPDSKHPLHFDISYEEIGYKNLKIFDR